MRLRLFTYFVFNRAAQRSVKSNTTESITSSSMTSLQETHPRLITELHTGFDSLLLCVTSLKCPDSFLLL
ncbi:hypothetical protein AMELA_G00177660 [Ameiurus melas]|uniref:Uncharacterized protein n=1 Tax=Ameiurus melas TaxID=219545 RepID=A0A7J6A9C1_AMEME|nr:hypothetical protein AMELA_G00177660 [Ameiurus melas]